MKVFILFPLIFIAPFSFYCSLYSDVPCIQENSKPQRKILILSSNGGYGHTAVANTLKAILSNKYDIKVVHPINRLKICGVHSGEDLYNSMLQHGWIRSMNTITKYIAPRLFKSRKKRLNS